LPELQVGIQVRRKWFLMAQAVRESEFPRYLRSLKAINKVALESGGIPYVDAVRAREHLNGRAGRELRQTVPLAELRVLGAFFTGEQMAQRLIESVPTWPSWTFAVDPACGCGDLLLPLARQLPVEESLTETLKLWGESLAGIDVVPEFVEITRERLLLLAIQRGASHRIGARLDLAKLLPGLRVGNGVGHPLLGDADLVVINPPYGGVVAPMGTAWGAGLVTDAAVWLCATLDRLRAPAQMAALLPDVLRSGSRYEKWRQHVAKHLAIVSLTSLGQFDSRTDIDVFSLVARKGITPDGHSTTWPSASLGGSTLGDRCGVMVGPVVEHRDPHLGPWARYITSRDLPQSGDYVPTRSRRFSRSLVEPPFVAIRRTSRPTDGEARVRPVLIRGDRSVAVENHLIVVRPERATVEECRRVAEILQSNGTTEWLNERIRTRHLTTVAVRGIPTQSKSESHDAIPA
jgi:hypothetical protein